MIDILRSAWRTVERDYLDETINSERCLQAVLYRALRMSLPSTDRILVEPSLDACTPDIVVRDRTNVKCIIELKCTPHWWVPAHKLRQDLEKLLYYYSKQDSKVGFDVFGPERIFDVRAKVCSPARPEFAITAHTWYAFAVLTRYDDKAGSLEHLLDCVPGLRNLPHFCLLAGAMNPDVPDTANRCSFRVSCRDDSQAQNRVT